MSNAKRGTANKALWIILTVYLLLMAYLLLYHRGYGTPEVIPQEDPTLYIRLPGGHIYPAPACPDLYPLATGNAVAFTAIGLDVYIYGQQFFTPVVMPLQMAVDPFEPQVSTRGG